LDKLLGRKPQCTNGDGFHCAFSAIIKLATVDACKSQKYAMKPGVSDVNPEDIRLNMGY